MHKNRRCFVSFLSVSARTLMVLMLILPAVLPTGLAQARPALEPSAPAAGNVIRLSQVYGGGGGGSGYYLYDYAELFNSGTTSVDLTGWSLQYGSSTGNFGSYAPNVYPFPASTIIQPGKYLLLQLGSAGSAGIPLPITPDLVYSAGLSMSASSGKIALVKIATALGCGATATPCTLPNPNIEDLVAYGASNNAEGGVPVNNGVALNAQQGGIRKLGGCQDTDVNNDDFDVVSGSGLIPRNSASPSNSCGVPTSEMTISKSAPNKVDVDETFNYTLSVGNSLGMPANQVVITDSLPVSVTFESASDGGVLIDTHVVSWTIPAMADEETAQRTITVTAPSIAGILVNEDYGVWASNWITRTVGMSVTTTVYDPSIITPIAIARAGGSGWYGTVQGNVTALPGTYDARSFSVQDATGGLYIYPSAGTAIPSMAYGDVVKVRGTLTLYHGLLEMSSIVNITRVSGGAVPEPLVTQTGSVGPTQGWLIKVLQGTASWSTPPPAPGASNWSFTLDDGSGPVSVFIDKDTGIDMRGFTSPMSMRIVGISSAYDVPQINPRTQSDIIDLRAPIVIDTVPEADATNVSLYYPIKAIFSKAMDPATINSASFILENSGGEVSGSVSYDAGTKTASFTPATALAESTLYTATLTTDVKDIYGIALTAPYIWTFTTGLADVTPPAIASSDPAPGESGIPLSANVVITFTEDIHPSTMDLAHIHLTGPFGSIPCALSYNSTTFAATLNPDTSLLASTTYSVTVLGTIKDWAGLTMGANSEWSFTTMPEPSMQVYFGDLHNHTSYSDGSGTPAQALAAGEAAGFDFMAITDHSYSINDAEWADTLSAVEAASNSSFVALRGFEYTQGAEGHINVYNTVRHAVRTDTTATCTFCDYTPNLEDGSTVQGFYTWVTISGTVGLDTAGTVMQFNHPGWINFNDWTYHPEVSNVAKLEEVGNGNGSSYTFSEDQYIRSLDYGWKVGATNNADTHTAYWGVNTDDRTGVVMAALTKDALLEALRERRTFATEDKNFSLTMKANGLWMGSEITNTGQIVFGITGFDPDGELSSLVQIITNQGKVAAEFIPGSAGFNWSPELHITPGVHYFYVKVTQADGDRIVSSPVWTQGSEDISVTDLTIQPTIPTTNNPSLLTVRVTNRNIAARSVSVILDVDGTPIGSPVDLSVPANGDNFANFSWQPVITGEVTVTAQITGAPAGDNPDDNARSLSLNVTDEHVPLILIDAGKGNLNATGNEMEMFIDDLSAHKYNVLKNLDELTATDLNPDVVKLLFITAPASAYTAAELTEIGNYVDAGGNLWLSAMSDYSSGAEVANRENAILAAIEAQTGGTINMRFNDDEILDGNDNNGYPWGVYWSSFPSENTTGIGTNVESLTSWSVASLVNRTMNGPLTANTPGVQIVVQGDLDTGYTGPDRLANHTTNTDADSGGDAYIYNPTWHDPWDVVPPDAVPVPMAAVTDLGAQGGRIMLYGDSNDAFNKYAYVAGDGKQNELFNLESVMWLMGEPLHKSTIAQARAQAVINQPDNLDKLVWVEGDITAAYGEFFNVLYVQDETGGITVHAPAGDIDPTAYTRGTHVRVVGTIGIYNGDTEIEFFEAEMVQVIDPGDGEVMPLPMSTYQADQEDNQGWLSVITGTVTAKVGEDTIFVNDGSGPVRVFLDGYNGDFSDILACDVIRVSGLVSEDGIGQRIRVRNHRMHPGYADDITVLSQGCVMFLPITTRH